MKTYLMTLNNKPLIYVFDEDNTVSYTPADSDIMGEYCTRIFTEKYKACSKICAQVDYALAGAQLQLELLSITQQKPGDGLLTYLKTWRNQYLNIGAGLKAKDGIVQNMYDDSHRKTRIAADKEIKEISRYV